MGHRKRMTAILTPRHIVHLARVVGALGALVVAVLTLGPFQGLEQVVGLNDKAAHAIAFYGLAVMAFVVMPARRRTDLAVMVLAFGVAIEIVQGLTGRSASLTDLLADAAGVMAATLPGMVERLRHNMRHYPYMRFSDIARLDRRRRPSRSQGVPGAVVVRR